VGIIVKKRKNGSRQKFEEGYDALQAAWL